MNSGIRLIMLFAMCMTGKLSFADVITVNTNNDVVDGITTSIANLIATPGADGMISLREAIHAANNTPGEDEIRFAAGTNGMVFLLDIGSTDEDMNMDGDLDLLDPDGLIITGNGQTNTILDGNHDHVDDSPYGERIFDQHMGDLAIRGVTIQNGNTPMGLFPDGVGGGIRNRNAGGLIISQTRIVNNRAEDNGGGLNFSSSGQSVILTGCSFEMNVSLDIGGGASLFGSSGTSHEITDCRFYSNQATNSGGGMYLSAPDGTSSVRTTTVENNMSLSSSGGGITFSSSCGTLFLSKSTISGNSAGVDGGGLFLNATGGSNYLNGVTVFDNMAGDQGGGIAAHGGTGVQGSSLFVFTNCTISANRANLDGGGVSIGTSSGQELNLNFVTITQNTADDDDDADGDGGGFHVFSDGTINIQNSIIQGNTDNSPGNHDCSNSGMGTINSLGGNVFGFDADCMTGPNDTNLPANLGPLQNNGGPTETHAIGTNSAAYNFAACDTIDMDQRMFFRIDGECDSGAYEFGASAESIPTLGQWGLILLGLILMIIGTVALQQRAAHSC